MSSIPGLSAAMQAALDACQQGNFPNNRGAIRVTHKTWCHRVAITTALAANQQFCNVNRAIGVWNGPPNGTLQNDQFFLATGLQISIRMGTDVTGAVDAEGALSQKGTTNVLAANFEWFKNAHDQGVVSFRVGDFDLVDQVQGLTTFPTVGGMTGFAAAWGTTATQEYTIGSALNGGPGATPYRFSPAYPILPGFPMLGSIAYIGTPPAIPSNLNAFFDFRIDGWYGSGR